MYRFPDEKRATAFTLLGSIIRFFCSDVRHGVASRQPATGGFMSMFRLILVLTILGAALAMADDSPSDSNGDQAPPVPTSFDAREALRKYQITAKAADDACEQAKMVADKKLVVGLKAALGKATRDGNINDADAINAQIAAANKRIDDEKPAVGSGSGLVVLRALYGPESKETADVTATIRRSVQGGSIQFRDLQLPDVAGFQHKTLLILGTYGGVPFSIRIFEGGFHLFSFGPPSSK
jgi:hypothetical protein